MASNSSLKVTEGAGTADWVEIYNPRDHELTLTGWSLTDDVDRIKKWKFPEGFRLLPNSYCVLTLGDGRDIPFRLKRSGEFLGLVSPTGRIVSDFGRKFPVQIADLSYGRSGGRTGYLERPTPGKANAPVMAEDSCFGLQPKSGAFLMLPELRVMTGSARNAVSVNGNKAKHFAPGQVIRLQETSNVAVIAGDPAIRTTGLYLLVDKDAAGFNSNLPIVVLTTFNKPLRKYRSERFQSAGMITYDVRDNGRAMIGEGIDYIGPVGLRVRGHTSKGYAKKSYAVELWNGRFGYIDEPFNGIRDDDKKAAILNFPKGSDWVFHGPFSDKTLMRNYLAYGWWARMGHYSVRRRFVELFLSEHSSLRLVDYLGVYLLVEKIKQGKARVQVQESRGFILRCDYPDPKHNTVVRTETVADLFFAVITRTRNIILLYELKPMATGLLFGHVRRQISNIMRSRMRFSP